MDTTIITGLTGIFGSLLGGSASVATAWVTQRTANKRKEFHAELTRRETLYGEFINECSARALDSLENTLEKSERLLSIYSLLNRIRLCASDSVLAAAEGALAAIAEQYFRPNLTLEQLRALFAMAPTLIRSSHSQKLVVPNSNRCIQLCSSRTKEEART